MNKQEGQLQCDGVSAKATQGDTFESLDEEISHLSNRSYFAMSDNPVPPSMVRGMGYYPTNFGNKKK